MTNKGSYVIDLGQVLKEIGYVCTFSQNGTTAALNAPDSVNVKALNKFITDVKSVSYKQIWVSIVNCTFVGNTNIRYNPIPASAVYEIADGGLAIIFSKTSLAAGNHTFTFKPTEVTIV